MDPKSVSEKTSETMRLKQPHPAASDLILALDAELPALELAAIEDHLASCAQCRQTYREFGGISVRLESLVAAVPVSPSTRDRLTVSLQQQREAHALCKQQEMAVKKPLSRYAGWSLAAAAGLVLCVWLAPHKRVPLVTGSSPAAIANAATAPRTFEALGETFVALPYSNSELPLTAHVVQMRVPAASLNRAGVMVEPISLEASSPNRAVLADVLLGLDGEPLGVHVVETD